MTHLRKMMLEELERRNFAETTKQCYIQAVEEFASYFHRPPDQLGPEHIREFQAHLFTARKLAPNTVNQRLAALRFFFVKTLRRPWNADETPYPRKVIHIPEVLSPAEVARLIDSAALPFHRVILMTLYATGMRRAELTHLKVSDIDSQRMVIRIRGGKGRKDREVMLSLLCFQLLASASDTAAVQSQPEEVPDSCLWKCPRCGGPMIVILRVGPPKCFPRSPPAEVLMPKAAGGHM